jgi:hypothetical protein
VSAARGRARAAQPRRHGEAARGRGSSSIRTAVAQRGGAHLNVALRNELLGLPRLDEAAPSDEGRQVERLLKLRVESRWHDARRLRRTAERGHDEGVAQPIRVGGAQVARAVELDGEVSDALAPDGGRAQLAVAWCPADGLDAPTERAREKDAPTRRCAAAAAAIRPAAAGARVRFHVVGELGLTQCELQPRTQSRTQSRTHTALQTLSVHVHEPYAWSRLPPTTTQRCALGVAGTHLRLDGAVVENASERHLPEYESGRRDGEIRGWDQGW